MLVCIRLMGQLHGELSKPVSLRVCTFEFIKSVTYVCECVSLSEKQNKNPMQCYIEKMLSLINKQTLKCERLFED